MSGGRAYSPLRFFELVRYVGARPLRAGRVGLAVVLWRTDMEAYWKLGRSVTGATYVKAPWPGELPPPRGLVRAVRHGLRLGRIEHHLRAGRLTGRDAAWLTRQWGGRVPV